jgi:hypothetical protein
MEALVSNWREVVLKSFVPNVAKLTLVSDCDSLLQEEKLAMELKKRGFDLIEFNDPIEFRYAYESKYRSSWDRGEHTDLVVILRVQGSELEGLPYDLLQAGRHLSFNLGELFPNLSYPVIEQLDTGLLDDLFEAQNKMAPQRMGDNATKDFILRHIFGVAAELITTETGLLRFLLRLHYGNSVIPQILAKRLVEILQSSGKFEKWDLCKLVSDAEAFYVFIQERWPIFLENLNSGDSVKESGGRHELRVQGPELLPFEHQDIRIYIDNLFIEGKLKPVELPDRGVEIDEKSWISSGIAKSKGKNEEVRISRLLEILGIDKLSMDLRYSDWIEFAIKWAELTALMQTAEERHRQKYYEASQKVNKLFADWLEARYASLINLSPSNPAMLHHLPRFLARQIEGEKNKKIALVVIDGLSLDQWVTVRNIIQEQNKDLVLRESAAFAWIPTITSVSRQAIFSGKAPFFFPSSVGTTNNEEKLWRQFWEGCELSRLNVVYKRGLGDDNPETEINNIVNSGQTKVVGLVIDKIDKIMHGMQLGTAGMHNQIAQWCQAKYLISLINWLLDENYDTWITSDHGNIESLGKGRPAEGAIAETRGERVRVYPSAQLRSQVYSKFNFAREWAPSGLPNDYFPLVATGNDAFIKEGEKTVAHGGIAIEEVIVPLIKVERRA